MITIGKPVMRDDITERDCFRGDLRVAIIEHHPKWALPWAVRRISHTLRLVEIVGGCDSFHTLKEAREWVKEGLGAMYQDKDAQTVQKKIVNRLLKNKNEKDAIND